MKNMAKNKNKLYTLIALVIIIGFLAFLQSDTAEYSYRYPFWREAPSMRWWLFP